MAGKFRRPSTPAQRAKAAAARDAKLAALHQALTEQVRALATGLAWRRWLDVGGRFHTYSFNNTLLPLAQKPDATRVAGYNLWRELGRQVTKGEQGLMILAPVTRRSADAAAARTAAERTAAADPVVDDPAATTGARHVVGFPPGLRLGHHSDHRGATADPAPTAAAGRAGAGRAVGWTPGGGPGGCRDGRRASRPAAALARCWLMTAVVTEAHGEEHDRSPVQPPPHRRPPDQHRHAADRAAPDDVLRGPALEQRGYT